MCAVNSKSRRGRKIVSRTADYFQTGLKNSMILSWSVFLCEPTLKFLVTGGQDTVHYTFKFLPSCTGTLVCVRSVQMPSLIPPSQHKIRQQLVRQRGLCFLSNHGRPECCFYLASGIQSCPAGGMARKILLKILSLMGR